MGWSQGWHGVRGGVDPGFGRTHGLGVKSRMGGAREGVELGEGGDRGGVKPGAVCGARCWVDP